jgi:hypothetical protein
MIFIPITPWIANRRYPEMRCMTLFEADQGGQPGMAARVKDMQPGRQRIDWSKNPYRKPAGHDDDGASE